MFTLSQYFNNLLINISPPKDRINNAETIPAEIRSFLEENDDLKTIDPYSRLIGSYARKTYVGDIKDVDILVFVDNEYEGDSPDFVLRHLKDILENYESQLSIEVSPQRRSIHMFFKSYDFHLDIVPALLPNGIENEVLIPDKSKEKWLKSHPIGYGKKLSELNSKNGQKVIPSIRLLKHWRDFHMIYKRPKSYWLECMIFHKLNKGKVQTEGKSLAEVFGELTDLIYEEYKEYLSDYEKVPWIKDPMLGNNVATNWERSHFEAFMNRMDETRKWAQKALEAEEKEEAVKYWQKIFGIDFFPTSVEDYAKSTSSMLKAGAFVNSSGHIATNKSRDEISTDIKLHRFYGK